MARIVENPQGRRMIRLSAEDILSVVNQYQQVFNGQPPVSYTELFSRLNNRQIYVPEEA